MVRVVYRNQLGLEYPITAKAEDFMAVCSRFGLGMEDVKRDAVPETSFMVEGSRVYPKLLFEKSVYGKVVTMLALY